MSESLSEQSSAASADRGSGEAASHPFLDELKWRGLFHQVTDEAKLAAHLHSGVRTAYVGFDPTADSLTIGNFIPIKLLMHWQRTGHRPIAVLGGGTGLIGDPSGKSAERQLLTRDIVERNVEGQRRIFERCLDFSGAQGAKLVNNLDWLGALGYIEVLRDVGKHFSVNAMIQRDSVRERLHNREQGISYTEFSYMVLQAYDYLHLHKQGVTVQMGGSDQWGNIVSGCDLIRRAAQGESFAVTAPLVTRSDGGKFGKSEAGAIWLSADRTSPYAFYQFWLNTDDNDVVRYLKLFTFFDQTEIAELEASHKADAGARNAHRALARHMTELLHGLSEREGAEAAAQALFSGEISSLSEATLREALSSAPTSTHGKTRLFGDGFSLLDALAETGLCKSKREAREMLEKGSVLVNGRRAGIEDKLTADSLLFGTLIALRRGKKNWHLLRFE
jgi:tyrosyl-tRNA synthetase